MDHATPGAGRAEEGAPFPIGQHVTEERRGSRVGRIDHAYDEQPPILYRLYGPRGGKPWIAWHKHLRPATPAEVAAYEADSASGRLPH